MNKRERKPNQLLNDIIVFPRRSCEHKELQESTPNDSLDFKPYYKLELSKKFATTYDKDDGEFKMPRRKQYHEITGHFMKDNFGKKDTIQTSFNEYFKSKKEDKIVNYRYENAKNSFLNVYGTLPIGIDKV